MNKIFTIIPYITEKTSSMLEMNKFTFLLKGNAEKIEIYKFIENKFDVNIKSINILLKKSKKVRRGKYSGQTKSYKKIIVTLKDEKNIEVLKELF